jgi:hypothetical protein
VTPGSGAAGYLAFYTALLYLSQSPDAAAIIQDLEQSPDLYQVGVSDLYLHDGRSGSIVRWNPHQAACVRGGVQSPAMQLLHELVHIWEQKHGLDSTDEEATTKITNPAAGQLGEPTRLNYSDGRRARTPWPLPIPSRPAEGKKSPCQ